MLFDSKLYLSPAVARQHIYAPLLELAVPPPAYKAQIKFFKNTMFRKTIEAKSPQETREVWESFLGMAKGAIHIRHPGE